MSFRFVQNSSQTARTIRASTNLRRWNRATPRVNNQDLKNPDNVNEVPIQDGQIHGRRVPRFSSGKQKVTNSQIKPPDKNMKPMESSCLKKSATKDRITKSKRCTRIFQILAIQEQYTQSNSCTQMQTNRFHVSSVDSVFSSIRSKIAPQQKLSISFGQSKQFYRYNTERGPAHPDLNSRHKCPVLKPPQQPYEEHSFTPNKQHHPQMLPGFYFSGMEPENTFTTYITPPHGRSVSQTQECKSSDSGSTCVLVEHQHHRSSQPQKTQPSQSRPRTRINQMISMMGPTSFMASGSGAQAILPGANKIARIPFIRTDNKIFVIQNFQSHCNKK